MLSRRDMLTLGLTGGAAFLLSGRRSQAQMGGGGMGGGGMGGGGMGGGVIDPPIGAALAKYPEMPSLRVGNLVTVDLEAGITPVNVNGTMANLFTYNGLAPAPVIRVKQGDKLHIHFTNSLPYTTGTNMLGFTRNVTNLHVHGMHVSPEEPADAAHIAIYPMDTMGAMPMACNSMPMPGMTHPAYMGCYDYEYDLMHQEPGCLNFYHPHSHGVVAEQYWGGMTGLIEVADPVTVSLPYETRLLVLKDIDIVGNEPAPHATMMDYMHGKEGGAVMVNGQVNPALTISPGQVQRWRVLNASTARFYKLSLEGHTLHVIGTDGGLLDKPYPQSYVILSPGERVDLLVKASTTKRNYRLLSLPYSRMGNMSSAQITLLTMVYPANGPTFTDVIPPSIHPDARRLSVNLRKLPTRRYELGMGMGRGYINGHDFDVMPDETHSTLGTYEIWEIVNPTGMDHPWHQHVNPAQVLSITGGDPAYRSLYTTAPARKDVTLVPKGGSVRLLVPVTDWPGMTMYHCHILEHEDIGMMGMWHIMEGKMPM